MSKHNPDKPTKTKPQFQFNNKPNPILPCQDIKRYIEPISK